jgi:hypothetical protein
MPIRLAEMLGRQLVRDLLQRAPQPNEIVIAPQPRLHQPPAVEVEQIHEIIADQQNVVRIQIRMTHAQIVKHANAATDRDPPENRNPLPPHQRSERDRFPKPLGDDVRRVREPVPSIARSHRRGHRQPRPVQVIQQLPLAKRTRRELPAPPVAIARDLRDQPASVVVPEHQSRPAIPNEMHGAASKRLAIDLATLAPKGRLEPARRRVAGPGGVI